MALDASVRPPLFAEGIRKEVLAAWYKQGMPAGKSLQDLFTVDRREEFEPNLWPIPYPRRWASTLVEANSLSRKLNPNDPRRLTKEWQRLLKIWPAGDLVRMLFVHHGFFETLGVDGWPRLKEIVVLLKDNPAVIQTILQTQGEFCARLVDRILEDLSIEAAVFSEPIGDNNGPLISPRTYCELVLPGYQPILDVLARRGVKTIILRTYANCGVLIPALLEAGFNCLWAVEVYGERMDYRNLRREFGAQLRLIGGIDLDVLRKGKDAIRREVEEKVPPLMAQGGYIPLADGRVRADVPWESYRFYRQLLQEVVKKK